MSKEFPMDSDYREAIPCEFCGIELECFHINPDKLSCSGCERFYETSRAIMRFENITKVDGHPSANYNKWIAGYVCAELWAGPQLMGSGSVYKLLELIKSKGWIVDGVNYSSYQVKRAKQRAAKEAERGRNKEPT